MNTFVFQNSSTDERREAAAGSLNLAARDCGIDIPYRGKLPEPWCAVECRSSSGTIIWSDPVKKSYPELRAIAETIADSTTRMINQHAGQVESAMPYKSQFILETVIEILQRRV